MFTNRLSIRSSCLLSGSLNLLLQSVSRLSNRDDRNALSGPVYELHIALHEVPRVHHIHPIPHLKDDFPESFSQDSQSSFLSPSASQFDKFEDVTIHSPFEGCSLNLFVLDLLAAKHLRMRELIEQIPLDQGGILPTVHLWSAHLELHLVIHRPLPGRERVETYCDSVAQWLLLNMTSSS